MDQTIDLTQMGQRAQLAARQLGQLGATQKVTVLQAMASALIERMDDILAANEADLAATSTAEEKFLDRLRLDTRRVEAMAAGLKQVAALPDPIGDVVAGWQTEDGLQIAQKRVPLGVVGMIYEARPNVTVDATGLCLKSGNAVILRGGKEALQTNQALVTILRTVLAAYELPVDAVQLVTDPAHAVAQEMMNMVGLIDVLIPRGGQGLIQTVVQNAKVPVIETGAGNCHIYVDRSAEVAMATEITVNAKVQRPSVCNAAEKLLVHRDVAADQLPVIVAALRAQGVQVRGDDRAQALVPDLVPATEADWATEYNDLIMAVKVVDSEEAAIAHINRYGTRHSEAIVTSDYQRAQDFLNQVDAACVYVNASTRFTDGEKFGFGAEIGISTQKLHARGPMGLKQLTTTKYQITGQGQIRA